MNKEQLRVKEYMKQQRRKSPRRFWCYDTIGGHRRRGFTVLFRSAELEAVAAVTEQCHWCGCQLNWSCDKGKVSSDSPTLDRKDNTQSLRIANVRIICHACNCRKGRDTEQEFINFCRSVAARNCE